MELTRFEPMRPMDLDADAHDEWRNYFIGSHTRVEPKLDGVRTLIHCTPEGVFATTRGKAADGSYNQFQDNIPHIRDHQFLQNLGVERGYTVLDGELIVPAKHSLQATMSVVGSHPPAAIAAQEERGYAEFWAFDMPFYAGDDIRTEPLWLRKQQLENLFEPDPPLMLVPTYTWLGTESNVSQKDLVKSIIDAGFEGAVLKYPDSSYTSEPKGQGDCWYRYKERLTVDAQVVGWTEGAGRFKGMVGSLQLAVTDQDGHMRVIGNVNAGADDVRMALSTKLMPLDEQQILDEQLIVEIEAQRWTPYGSLRHPRIKSWRDDKKVPEVIDFSKIEEE